jgi:ABC-type multidrug transport system fused ATPase/permease subunit
MGPSILAAAFTTLCSAIIMIFTVITFFQKFAIILFCTIVMATIGSIMIFLTLTTTFGPSEPTVFIDHWVDKMYRSPLCCNFRNSGAVESSSNVKSNTKEYEESSHKEKAPEHYDL